MDILTKIDENKKWNARFLRAFDWLCSDLNYSQAQLAKEMKTNSPLISDYRSGKKRVSEDIINRLLIASDGRIYRRYIIGKSNYMLIENVSDEQFIEDEKREYNPDYDVMHPEQAKEHESEYQAIPAWADSIIQIASTQVRIIEELRREISSLRSELQDIKNSMNK